MKFRIWVSKVGSGPGSGSWRHPDRFLPCYKLTQESQDPCSFGADSLFSCGLATLLEALSVRRSVGPLVRPSVGNAFVKIDEKWTYTDSK